MCPQGLHDLSIDLTNAFNKIRCISDIAAVLMSMHMPQPDAGNDGQFRDHFEKSASIHPNPKVLVVLTVDIIEGDGPGYAFHVVLGSLTKCVVHVHLSADDAWLTCEHQMACLACLSPF